MKTQFYTKEQLTQCAPAIFASTHDGKRSDKYTFVSTEQIIDNLADLDFGVARVRVPKVRKADPEHCRHEVTFRPFDDSLSFEDPRIRTMQGGNARVYPELKVLNSSDGTCSFEAMVGLFALICSNGMTVAAAAIGELSLRHQYFDANEAFSLVNEFTNKLPQVTQTVQEWSEIGLSVGQRLEFAAMAANLRWPNPTFDPKLLLQPRRHADTGTNLWTTFNVIQENLLKGGFTPNVPKARKVRTLNNISKSNGVNDALWGLAANYASWEA